MIKHMCTVHMDCDTTCIGLKDIRAEDHPVQQC